MKKSTIPAIGILAIMLVVMIASVWNDSATMDELAHIPAGFGYITQGDYRLNPEHPPLVKALSALVAEIVARPHFPIDTPYWRDEINGQWAQGAVFLYESGNDADSVIFWSRLPLIILTAVLGWLIFLWTRKKFGAMTALLALTFFAFSPTILAHGRYVTTDIGATLGFFIGITSFIAFLERPDRKRIIIAGLCFGIAQLLKFSLVLLVPIDLILLTAWVAAGAMMTFGERMRMALNLFGRMLIASLIALAVIWGAYAVLVRNYPQEKQLHDTQFLLSSYGLRSAVDMDIALIRNPVTRPLGEYLLGVLMVQQRSAGGNTAFFLGEVSAAGSRLYFPLLYVLKEPLALHFLLLVAIATGVWKFFRMPREDISIISRMRRWIGRHFAEFSALAFIAFYWLFSIKSPLNIGVRHVLPTFPFIYILIAQHTWLWLAPAQDTQARTPARQLSQFAARLIVALGKYGVVCLLLLWLVIDTIIASPHFLSYYNELAGGSRNGWKIAVDSNYDWGQDLKRLADFMDQNNIGKISLEYFGGGSPRYYLGERFEPWQSSKGRPHGYFAVSSTFRQGALGAPAPGFYRRPEDSYDWLMPYEPIAQIGNSIFVYDLP